MFTKVSYSYNKCAAGCGQGTTAALCGETFPGIRARVNQRGFQYASSIMREIINREVHRVVIPPITECLPGPIVSLFFFFFF
ncbi:unnamed protein product [Enterobius vermicularis]|uniref:Pept_C1 domain-containing protein n=1 Tax=Enterobius vermicularis TaxID=51028 RepID=A0A0N4V8F4_ENTVE|nr:unnamed protein product [Enterobius vermicularis]